MDIQSMLVDQIYTAGKRGLDAALAEARSAGAEPVDDNGLFDCNFEGLDPFQIQVTANEIGGVAVAVLEKTNG